MQTDPEKERKELLKRYRLLLKYARPIIQDNEEKKQIKKAFQIAVDAHKHMRRKSGEPYIYHPIAVAQIVVQEMGLGATSIICALLHDVVEDTELTLEDMEKFFGDSVSKIIDGLTKISGVFDNTQSIQAENFRKIVLTLSEDIRVILIKIADRLHNMRTLDHMARDKQLKIASETLFLYAPLAHRLGLYNIKTELEDLCLKYLEPEQYQDIIQRLEKSKDVMERFIRQFTQPIKKKLDEAELAYEVKGRTKSIYSIWNKIHKKGVPFEEIYDIFAIRIILDVPLQTEKSEIWKTYSVVTDLYQPKPDRLRDWISFPRANGYESLHVTVMSPTGKWVEVQIRTKRMDEVAERGYAAHWKYKESNTETAIDEWITKIREFLENKEEEAVDFVDAFKLNLYTDEIYVFTPKGELRTLPANATALDFAYEIHSDVGDKCLGAKVNNRLVPLSHKLNSGDQIEIITSQKQSPKEDWLHFVNTGKARTRIKAALKEEKKRIAEDGKEIFERKLRRLNYNFNPKDINIILKFFKLQDELEFYHRVGKGLITSQQIKNFYKEEGKKSWYSYLAKKLTRKGSKNNEIKESFENLVKKYDRGGEQLLIGENAEKIDYTLAPCCNPIPGDEVFGFVTINDGIKIHKINCPNAIQLLSNYAYRIVKAKWTGGETLSFLTGLTVKGIDDVGIVNRITKLISNQMKVNMRSLSFDSNDGVFEGKITLFVQDTRHLNELIVKLKKLPGVISVDRIDEA
ncbi:MAG: bifunctional (p)ppGpp synthetase/guanosine-3',5'-bis(diphosphate) 3'-pyrophosphohydrolase [Candidatus Competibacteraceae bacterium]|nr:bifunctional (p)ppGpp synthetase/guanosine-3',5'-bis(diphosphate) 3'-pyrophosphohydrolase [Candidatus Competibacteraceae bacterium]